MNGAETSLRAATALGVDTCFANPGTTEMEFVAALDAVDDMRAVLGLAEGVVTGAADGFGRATGRPALTLMHLGPGLANGLANLHNARRAHTPIVNVIGDHATWHLDADAPLTSDIDALAGAVSRDVIRAKTPEALAAAVPEAVATAVGPPSGVVSIVVPQDAAWEDVTDRSPTPRIERAHAFDSATIERAARSLNGTRTGLLLGGVVRRSELDAAASIQARTGCKVLIDTFTAVLERGSGVPSFPRVPYFPEQAIEVLADIDVLVCASAPPPVAFFGYRHLGRSTLTDAEAEVVVLTEPGVRSGEALAAVSESLGPRGDEMPGVTPPEIVAPDSGRLTVGTLGAILAAAQPEDAIIVDEAATSGVGWAGASAASAPHEAYSLTGGAIGLGLPCAVGAAVGAPDRKVIALQADGSGLYTAQALWTMARESLDVTVVVCANRAYRILQVELARTGHTDAGATAQSLTELQAPIVDWVSLARGFGVDGLQVDTAEGLASALDRSLGDDGPFLIEAVI